MSEINETSGAPEQEISQEEKIEMVKAIFSTLDIDNKAIFTQWCHEEIEKGAGQYLGEKMTKMNEDFNRVVARLSDKIVNTGTKVYNTTNEVFKFASEEKEDTNDNTSKNSGIFD